MDGLEHTADGPALRVRVRALPEKGAANAALVDAVARWLAVPQSCVEVVAGGKARLKTLFIAGDAGALGERISSRVAGLRPDTPRSTSRP